MRFFTKIQICIMLMVGSSLQTLQSQTKDICQNEDCPPEILNIQLDATALENRTVQFQTAYQEVQNIKAKLSQNAAWQQQYDNWALGGQNCLRLYHLEGLLANEYNINTDFKTFVDQQTNQAPAYLENGFQASRKALNLEKRMKNDCPREIKKLEEKPGPKLAELPPVYQDLGQALGYFDEKGNVLKPLEAPPTPSEKPKKMNKKQQIAQLKEQVAQLATGPTSQSKVDNLKDDLVNKAKPKLGFFKKALNLLKPQIAALLPPPVNLLLNIGKITDKLGILKKFKPKIPRPKLFDKIAGLFNKGKKLGDKVEDAAGKADNLRDQFNKLGDKAKDMESAVKDRLAEVDKLQEMLDELAKKKADLTEKLEDRPKKILDQLKQEVADAQQKSGDFLDKLDKEAALKDKILSKIEDLEKEKEALEEGLKDLQDKEKTYTQEAEQLEKGTDEAEAEVETVKAEEANAAAIDVLKKELADLQSEAGWEEEIKICEEELQKLLAKINPLAEKQSKFKKFLGKIAEVPKKLLGKLSDLKLFQNKLKLGKDGIALGGKLLAKLDQLINKGSAISGIVEVLTGKKTRLQEKIEGFDEKLSNIQEIYDGKIANLDQLKEELGNIVAEKTQLNDQLGKPIDQVEVIDELVKDFVNRYQQFGNKEKCLTKADLEEKIAKLKEQLAEIDPEITDLDKELTDATTATDELEIATNTTEQEIDEEAEKAKRLQQEAAVLEQEYGKAIQLEPVTVKEWTDNFEIKRPYWDAVFHPDDEVVEGYVGKYFQVRLKDAEKNVKLLFGAGEYFMEKSDFRDNYGSTIGAFVTEALHSLKKADAEQVKLFVQGSADITGHKTFKGKMDQRYPYESVSVLPQNQGKDSFASAVTIKSIPAQNFTNDHLPDLRGHYLKEMIGIYSRKKLVPILLEGSVKTVKEEGERNAIIYLFIPEYLLEE